MPTSTDHSNHAVLTCVLKIQHLAEALECVAATLPANGYCTAI
jgi:hypothetical protein